MAYERPQRFRLVAGLAISFAGNEVDLGSNDEVFWFWIHRNTPPAVYYCRHDEFASSPIRNSLPFDPHLVIEAFGLVQLDPNGRYEGPFPVRGGYEIHTIRQTPEGPARKDIVIEGQQGLVVEQRIYDARQQLIATATTGRFHRDDYTGLIMPTLIQVRSPLQQFSMEITLAAVKINEPIGNPQQLWTMPIYQGSPPVNLCRPNREMFPGQPAAVSSPSGAGTKRQIDTRRIVAFRSAKVALLSRSERQQTRSVSEDCVTSGPRLRFALSMRAVNPAVPAQDAAGKPAQRIVPRGEHHGRCAVNGLGPYSATSR